MTRAFSWLLVALAVVLTGPTQSHAESALVAPQAAAADRESPERLPHARGARAPIERHAQHEPGACEHAFGGGRHAEGVRVGASRNYDGQLTLLQVPNGAATQTVTPSYDSVGRLHTVVDSLSGVTSTIAYAAGGLPQSVTTSDGEVVTYAYGLDGPLLMSKAWSGSVSGVVSFTHDSFFRVASRAVNGGTPVTYNFDADGLYAGASGLVSYSVTRDFNGKNGLLTGSTLGSVSDALTYNGFGEPKTYAATFGGSPIYSSSITSRDADGRITGATETLAGTTHTWAFGYDAHGDLDSATEDGTATAYVFDPNGNRLSAGGPASTYDAQDRLLTSPGATYTYTNNGDLLTKVTSTGTATYLYDLRGALRSVSLPQGDTVAYVIDGQSRRVGRTWTHGAQKVTQGFLYDDQLHVAAELDGAGNVVSTFVYGTRFNVPDAMVRGGKTYRILSDWRGSVRAVVDANAGTVVETIDYDAWGNATTSDTTCAAGAACAPFQPFGFAGGLFDRETGLVRFGARDYDPSVGRWTQKDPIRFDGEDTNIYAYSGDDPINNIDPTGLIPRCPADIGTCFQDCDDDYETANAKCRRKSSPAARAICYGDAVLEYGICNAKCRVLFPGG